MRKWQININKIFVVVVVQLFSRVQLFVTQWTAAHQASLSVVISRSLLKLMAIELVMPSNSFSGTSMIFSKYTIEK